MRNVTFDGAGEDGMHVPIHGRVRQMWKQRWVCLVCGAALALIVSGCASSRPSGPYLPKPSTDPLPGSGRVLPSEENAVRGDAPAAFPDYSADLSAARSGGGTSTDRGGADSSVPPATSAPPTTSTPPGGSTKSTPTQATSPSESTSTTRSVPPATATQTEARVVSTFRTVQLLVASTPERAEEWRARAATVLGVPVRVVPEDGLYKLRIGSFKTEDAAEDMRRDAVLRGYVDAEVVMASEPQTEGGRK